MPAFAAVGFASWVEREREVRERGPEIKETKGESENDKTLFRGEANHQPRVHSRLHTLHYTVSLSRPFPPRKRARANRS